MQLVELPLCFEAGFAVIAHDLLKRHLGILFSSISQLLTVLLLLLQVVQVLPLEFIDRLLLTDLVIKLILIRALIAADQCLLLNGPELLLHFKEYPLVCDLLQVFGALQFLQLVSVQLEIVVLEEVYSLGISQIDFLLLLSLGMDLQAHYLFLLVHNHCDQSY